MRYLKLALAAMALAAGVLAVLVVGDVLVAEHAVDLGGRIAAGIAILAGVGLTLDFLRGRQPAGGDTPPVP